MKQWEKLERYRNIHAGRRCFVVGNGPSLNKLDMSLIKDEITFGSNRVYHGFRKWGFGFTYWSIEDLKVADDIASEWTRELISSPPYSTTVFVPEDLVHHVQAHVNEYNNPCAPVNFTRTECFPDLFPFSMDPSEIYWGGTVTYLLLQLAAIMGCSPIILIGIDFSYVIPSSVTRLGGALLRSNEDDPNHFYPEYFGKGRKWHDPMLPRMRIAYMSAMRAAKQHGFQIYNATPGTKLDVFRRVDFGRAVQGDYRATRLFEGPRVALANINREKYGQVARAFKQKAKHALAKTIRAARS